MDLWSLLIYILTHRLSKTIEVNLDKGNLTKQSVFPALKVIFWQDLYPPLQSLPEVIHAVSLFHVSWPSLET